MMRIVGVFFLLGAGFDIYYTNIGIIDIALIISGSSLMVMPIIVSRYFNKSPLVLKKIIINILILFISLGIVFIPLKFVADKGSFAKENKLLKKSSNLINSGMYKEVEQIFSQENNRPEYMINLSTALIMQKKPEQAYEALKSIGNSTIKSEMQNYNYAMCCYQLEQYQTALEHLKKVIIYRPDLMEAYLYAGEASLKTEAYKAAQYYFRTAAEIAPEDPHAHYHLGRSYLAVMDFNNADIEFNKASKLTDDQELLKKISQGLNDTKYYLDKIHK